MTTSAAPETLRPTLVPGAGSYFTGDDHLRLTSWNSLASVRITLSGRILDREGNVVAFSEVHTPNTDRTAAAETWRRSPSWLLDLSVGVTGATPLRGQTFVRLDVVRGMGGADIVLSTLLRGYVTSGQRLGWPGAPQEDPLDGQGALRSIGGTDPAANTEISETVPTGARWRVLAVSFQLVTDATAANREVSIVLDDGTNTLFTSPAAFNHTASLTRRYSAASMGVASVPTQATDRQIVIPDLRLPAGARIRTATTAIQATDNYGAPRLLVEEWLEATA